MGPPGEADAAGPGKTHGVADWGLGFSRLSVLWDARDTGRPDLVSWTETIWSQ